MSAHESIIIIDIYSGGVRISDGASILADSKSYALIEADQSISVGEQAMHLVHLRPRECSTEFWDKLSDNSNTKLAISNSEIAYRHLEDVWKSVACSNQPVILITPITLAKNELGLLLGICKKLSIDVAGIVCNASLAMHQPIENCKAVFLDLQQQQLVLTELEQNKQEVSLKHPSRILNYGLQSFIQNAANSIARKFITETRFDPLHNAAEEQQFFDKLPLWLNALDNKDIIECKLDSGEKHFSIKCDKHEIQKANKRLFEDFASHLSILFRNQSNIAIFCGESCRHAYGLQDYLKSLPGCAVIQLDDISLSKKALLYQQEIIKGEQVHFVNTLPWLELDDVQALSFSSGKLSNLSSVPTHILLNGYAHSLQHDLFISYDSGPEPKVLLQKTPDCVCKIYADNISVFIQIFQTQQVILNDDLIETTSTVNIDDNLRIHGLTKEIKFIKVINHET